MAAAQTRTTPRRLRQVRSLAQSLGWADSPSVLGSRWNSEISTGTGKRPTTMKGSMGDTLYRTPPSGGPMT